jgi:hypothetical protein
VSEERKRCSSNMGRSSCARPAPGETWASRGSSCSEVESDDRQARGSAAASAASTLGRRDLPSEPLRCPDSGIVLLAAPSRACAQWRRAAFVPPYSCGAVEALHLFPVGAPSARTIRGDDAPARLGRSVIAAARECQGGQTIENRAARPVTDRSARRTLQRVGHRSRVWPSGSRCFATWPRRL